MATSRTYKSRRSLERGAGSQIRRGEREKRIAGGNVLIRRTGLSGSIIGRDGGLYQIQVNSPGRFYERDVWLESSGFRRI